MTQLDSDTIKSASAGVDSLEHQGEEDAHMHAMRRPHQTIEQAKEAWEKFKDDQLNKAVAALCADRPGELSYGSRQTVEAEAKAFTEFGKGLHAVMDETSPQHAGFQEWSGVATFGDTLKGAALVGLGVVGMLAGFFSRHLTHSSGELTISQEKKAETLKKMKIYFEEFVHRAGRKCPCKLPSTMAAKWKQFTKND